MINILNGVRVLDLSRYISGPFCARMLADMGAEVIKVEKAGHGDEGRFCGPMCNGESLYFSAFNRNKKSITIDFRSEKGQSVLRKLIEKSDIIVENFKAGTMAAMGLGYEEIKKINPRAVLVSITGFGQTGPDSKRPAYDPIISCRAHLFAQIGEGEFCAGPDLMSDTVAGIHGALAAMLALYDREKTGEGQWVDTCMLTSSLATQAIALSNYAMNDGQDNYTIDAPNGIYKTKDGYFNITSGPQPMFTRLRQLIDDPVIRDEKYLDVKKRIQDEELLKQHITKWTEVRTNEEIDQILGENMITCGRVSTWGDLLKDRQLEHRDDLVYLPVKNCGKVPYPRFPAKFSAHPEREDKPAPDLGEDNCNVLASLLGMSPEEVEEFTK